MDGICMHHLSAFAASAPDARRGLLIGRVRLLAALAQGIQASNCSRR